MIIYLKDKLPHTLLISQVWVRPYKTLHRAPGLDWVSLHLNLYSIPCYVADFAKAIFSSVQVQFSHSVVSNCLWPYGLQPPRLSCLRDSPGKNTGVGCQVLLQGIFPTQGSNPCHSHLLYWQAGSLPLAPARKPFPVSPLNKPEVESRVPDSGHWTWCVFSPADCHFCD